MYEFTDKYLTGITEIDEQHKKLFAIAEKAYQLIHNDAIADKYDYVIEVMEELVDYTKIHFAFEEKYMEEHNYGGLKLQKAQHDYFLGKIEAIEKDEIDENPEKAAGDILTFLTDWLIKHILELDKQIS